MGGAVLGQAIPGFWLGLMLIFVFSVHLGWLPTGGTGGLAHFVMPSVVLAAFYAARVARLTRSAVLETLGEEYVLAARAKGLGESVVIGKHTLKNAAIPIVTLAGLDLGQLLGGAVITETIFAWPGAGAAHRPGAAQPGLPGGARRRVRDLGRVHADQLRRRPPLRVARPAHPRRERA